ncbi:pseudouridine synthase pus4, partial [Teratosphaeriaceae sp. CCFEE 6253]
MGHGGTLDPLATGVLILGVGAGTKALGSFLACTKSYEAVVLFGVGTDSYDTEGKVVARGAYAHVTREKVEGALGAFRGEIMQRPPIFSALRVQGKRLYEYAREGKEVPVEIQERPVTVGGVEVVEWMDGGGHGYKWPEREAG